MWTRPEPRDEIHIDCPHCGQYVLSGWHEQTIPEEIDRDPSLRESLPAWIRSKNATGLIPPLDARAIESARKSHGLARFSPHQS